MRFVNAQQAAAHGAAATCIIHPQEQADSPRQSITTAQLLPQTQPAFLLWAVPQNSRLRNKLDCSY